MTDPGEGSDPPAAMRALEAESEVMRTPAGEGTIWRSWGEGAPVVLLHGGHGSWSHWIPQHSGPGAALAGRRP